MSKPDKATLRHYGVPGMKWGKRKGKSSVSGKLSKSTQVRNEAKTLSDSELRARINRIQMEKQYVQLSQPQISKGRKIAQELVANAAKQVASEVIKNAMSSAVKSALKAASESTKKG